MANLYLFCAVIGGAIFVIQFFLALVGLGDSDAGFADDIPDDIPDDMGAFEEPADHVVDHGSTWLFGVISFRTVVVALAFFGLAGTASLRAGHAPFISIGVAIASGVAAMYGVHYLMQVLYRLGHDGTARIERSVGRAGTVYIPIPASKAGSGKIHLQLQDRIMEYQAMTSHTEKLNTGAKVVVVGVIGPSTVEVTLSEKLAEA